MRGLYQLRRRRLTTRDDSAADQGGQDHSPADQRLVHELLEAQHREIVQLRNQGQISNQVMSRIEHDLDLEDAQLQTWETPE
jgi:CPA1 family monovalent cation:H+ antiporter